MQNFLENIINGLTSGSLYALIALGYTMVYGIAKMINFAHGDIIMVGAYTVCVCAGVSGMPIWLTIILAVVVCGILGVVIEKVAYKPLRNAPTLAVLITAIGVSYFLQNLCQTIFGADPKTVSSLIPSGGVKVWGITISYTTIITVVITVIVMIVLNLFIKKTRLGSAMRAVSEDKGAATLMGINSNRIISITFAIGSALAGVAGILYVCQYGTIQPTMGALPGIKAFVAAVIGGIGSVPGAMIGGIGLGLLEAMTKAYISTTLLDAIVFGILILVLLFMPTGILGSKRTEKV